jgi:hypothetical protein
MSRVQAPVDYESVWRTAAGVEDFGDRVSSAWATVYLASTGADAADLVVVDPGNGFHYLFDLAGSLSGEPRAHAPRILGVWGRSQPGQPRDHSRMRGFPRPARGTDDRGHLISCAAGGGYDINLLPMDAALNRGWSAEGARFRAMERSAAASPGTLFFIRPIYGDDSDRPARFEVGVQSGDTLVLDTFENATTAAPPMRLTVLRQAAAFPIDPAVVADCLDPASATDALFARGWRSGPSALSRAECNAIAGVTGHVAESVTEVLLDGLGWHVLWHFTGPGRHGVDLLMLTPDDDVVAVEVKGTLVRGRIPRLSRRELAQMSAAWIDKADNPGMAELGLESADVYGAVVAVNFADLTWRAALTADFADLRPVEHLDQLSGLDWLRSP